MNTRLLIISMLFVFYPFLHCAEEKLNIAVLDLKAINIPQEETILLTEMFRSEIYKMNRYRVMNREDMKEIMGEQAFQNSGLCDDTQCLIEIGNILKVNKIITGSIGKLDSTYSVTIKQIDIETSQNDKLLNYTKKCSKETLFEIMTIAAHELIGKSVDGNKIPSEAKIINEEAIDINSELILWCTYNSGGIDKSLYENKSLIQYGEFSFDRFGIPDNALLFSSNDTSVNFGNSPLFDIYKNFTFFTSFKADELPKDKEKFYFINKTGCYYICLNSKGQIELNFSILKGVRNAQGTFDKSVSLVSKESIIEVKKWHKIAVTADFYSGQVNLYFNNQLIDSKETGPLKPVTAKSDLSMGVFPNQKNISYKVAIDDFRMYKSTLNRTEIDSLFNLKDWRVEDIVYINNCVHGRTQPENTREPDSGPLYAQDRFGKEKQAWYFNGEIVFETVTSINDLSIDKPFSISFWMYQEDVKQGGYVIFDKSTPGRSVGIILDTSGNKFPGQQLRWLPNLKPVYGKTKYSLNEWHHIVLTYDSKNTKIYLDGEQEGESDYEVSIEKNIEPLVIGATQNERMNPDKYFKGKIDDILIYSKSLKPKEVELIYHEDGWK